MGIEWVGGALGHWVCSDGAKYRTEIGALEHEVRHWRGLSEENQRDANRWRERFSDLARTLGVSGFVHWSEVVVAAQQMRKNEG